MTTELIVRIPARTIPNGSIQGLPPLTQHKKERTPLAELLNVTLANTINLKSRVMQAKWHARQIDSSHMALALDELGDDLDLMADLLGQRMVALGHHPKALPADVTRMSRLPPFKGTMLWDSQLADAVAQSIDATKLYLEPTICAAAEAGDAATSDVLQRLKRRLHRW